MTDAPTAIAPDQLRDMIVAEGEFALLDVREEGTFGEGHLLFAASAPLSRLELVIDGLVPRRSAPVVLCSGGEADHDLVERAARRLGRFGYADVSYLEGGVEAWAAAGFEVFSGVNVPSKAFGELVEARCETPHVSAEELKAMQDGGEDVVVLDSRPWDEYRNMCIPGGIDVPGAELVLRIHDIAPDPGTTVVVNCAGRTRSIIGAQSLINAGVPNKVMALENGTMGWHLAGLRLAKGEERRYPALSDDGLARARERAAKVAERFQVPETDAGTLAAWRADDSRTLYILDVRDPAEYEAGHIDGARPAPGGQLVQATDRTVGVRGARLVLVDDDGVRAKMTASWLIQMGWRDVHVLTMDQDGGPGEEALVEGPHRPFVPGLADAKPEEIAPKELAVRMVDGEAQAVDLADSRHFRRGHVPGSRFAIRANMPGNLEALGDAPVVLTSDDGVLATLAAADLDRAGRAVRVLRGGTRAWVEAGLPLATGFIAPLDEPVDVWYRPYDLYEGTEQAMKRYLAWETGLPEQIARDGTAPFGDLGPGGPGRPS